MHIVYVCVPFLQPPLQLIPFIKHFSVFYAIVFPYMATHVSVVLTAAYTEATDPYTKMLQLFPFNYTFMVDP